MRAKHLLCALSLSGLALAAVGCHGNRPTTFEAYVIDLIDNHTSATDTPDDVAKNAVDLPDTQLQSDFAKYFP